MAKKTREAKAGELEGVKILEKLERLSRRPESRIDVERMLEKLSAHAQTYIRHLVSTGPASNLSSARATGLSQKEIETAIQEIEAGLGKL